jgi:hypothetical protein
MNYQNENTQNNPGNASQTPIDYRAEWETSIVEDWVLMHIYFELDSFGQVKVSRPDESTIVFTIVCLNCVISMKVLIDEFNKVLKCELPVVFTKDAAYCVTEEQVYKSIYKVNETAQIAAHRSELNNQRRGFQPRTYQIEIFDFGGEMGFVEISKETYEYWNKSGSKALDLLSNYDVSNPVYEFIPEHAVISKCNFADIVGFSSISGALFDLTRISVTNETGAGVLTCVANPVDCEKFKIQVEGIQKLVMDPKKNYLSHVASDSGVFFRAKIQLLSNFDASKLKLVYNVIIEKDLAEGWLLAKVFYDNKELINVCKKGDISRDLTDYVVV